MLCLLLLLAQYLKKKTKEPSSEYLPTNVPGSTGDGPAEKDVPVERKGKEGRLTMVQELPVVTALYDVQPETEKDLDDCSTHVLAVLWYLLFNLCCKA